MGILNFGTLRLKVKSLEVVGGQNEGVRTGHDALYNWVSDMSDDGGGATLVKATCPRWTFADAAVQSVTFIQEFPTTWTAASGRAFTARMPWSKEAVGAGNVVWRFSYRFVYLVGGNFLGAKTDVTHAPVAVPGAVGDFSYLADLASDIPITPGPVFGDAPQLISTITRVGTDAGDTYAGAASIFGCFFQRIDL